MVRAALNVKPSICRICVAACPILVEVVDGHVTKVKGDASNDVYHGYTCEKGRNQPEAYKDPDRLLHSLKRMPNGTFQAIPVELALDEIADKVQAIVAEHGPSAYAHYQGTQRLVHPAIVPMMNAVLAAMKSPWGFTASTLDQPGKPVSQGLHGFWGAPHHGFEDADVGLIIGANPLVSLCPGLPQTGPKRWLRNARARGYRLIVIDPRRTETAAQSDLFLQTRPGHDAAIVAGLINIILQEGLEDKSFIASDVMGFDALRSAVEAFNPDEVERRSGIPAADLIEAARLFATSGRGCAVCGTGPNMSGHGTLVEYLTLCLNTICGRWLRAGEEVWNPGVLTARKTHRAQALPRPALRDTPGIGVRGLPIGLAGPPSTALPERILSSGEGQIRALVSHGGNPVIAFPDQRLTIEALEALDLLVQIDPWMSATAQYAHYIIAPKLSLEMSFATFHLEMIGMHAPGCGVAPWAHVTQPVVEPPSSSEVIEDWEFFYGLAQRLGLQLGLRPFGAGAHVDPVPLDMGVKPTSDDLLGILARDGRVPLAEVSSHLHGKNYDSIKEYVLPKEEGCTERLDVGAPSMLLELASIEVDAGAGNSTWAGEEFPFRMVCRRLNSRYNSTGHTFPSLIKSNPYNAAYMHPDDLSALGVVAGDEVVIANPMASVHALVEPDDTLRSGLVSIAHCWGSGVPGDDDPRSGAAINRLISVDDAFDPRTGQPIMSNVPVSVRPVARLSKDRL